MRIIFIPIRSDDRLDYVFGADSVAATCGEISETYDFSELPDGVANEISPGYLPLSAVWKAEKSDGELTLHLRLTRGRFAPEEVRKPNNPYTVEGALRLLQERNEYIPPPLDEENYDDE